MVEVVVVLVSVVVEGESVEEETSESSGVVGNFSEGIFESVSAELVATTPASLGVVETGSNKNRKKKKNIVKVRVKTK